MTWFLLALAVTLFLLDIWVATELLSHVALLILAAVVASFMPLVGWQWQVAAFICSYLATLAFYYLFWKQIGLPFINGLVTPTRHVPSQEKIVGKSGTIVRSSGSQGVSVDGLIWPTTDTSQPAGSRVRVTAISDGVLSVEPTD